MSLIRQMVTINLYTDLYCHFGPISRGTRTPTSAVCRAQRGPHQTQNYITKKAQRANRQQFHQYLRCLSCYGGYRLFMYSTRGTNKHCQVKMEASWILFVQDIHKN